MGVCVCVCVCVYVYLVAGLTEDIYGGGGVCVYLVASRVRLFATP